MEDVNPLRQQAGLSVEEKVQMWGTLKSSAGSEYVLNTAADHEAEEEYTLTHYPEARTFLADSQACKWLLGKVNANLFLTEMHDTPADHIYHEIIEALHSTKHQRGYYQGVCQASFLMSWNIHAFIEEQYPKERDVHLGSIVTITGSGIDAQAMTCSAYMRQVWPTTGLETLQALQEAISNDPGERHECRVLFLIELFLKLKLTFHLTTKGGFIFMSCT